MLSGRKIQARKAVLLLWGAMMLTGCVADSHLWGLIPTTSDICAHGKDSITGNCRD